MIWFISDTHFNHSNIIEYDNRPFDSVSEMNQTIIANWNAAVAPDDEVYHLGDVGFHITVDFLAGLNGRKYLIRGNHDRFIKKGILTTAFQWVAKEHEFFHQGVHWLLSHYPEYSLKTRWNIHGHSHGKGSPAPYRVDLSCNLWGYRPVSFDELVAHIKQL